MFEELKPPLVELIAELRQREVDDSFLHGDFPPDRQRTLAYAVTDLFGHRPDSWRIDPTEHPFASGPGRNDVRITTNYHPDSLHSLFSTMHEYGHGLYSHQQPKHLERLPTGGPCSLGIHESQSRLWENLVGRSAPVLAALLPASAGDVSGAAGRRRPRAVPAAIHRQARSDPDRGRRGHLRNARDAPLRARAGHRRWARRAADLPQRWNEKMWDYLGVEVPDDGHGVLQDVHWSGGMIGYFSTYLIGSVTSVQIWQARNATCPISKSRSAAASSRRFASGSASMCMRSAASSAPGDAASRDRLGHRRAAVPRLPPRDVRIGLAAPRTAPASAGADDEEGDRHVLAGDSDDRERVEELVVTEHGR